MTLSDVARKVEDRRLRMRFFRWLFWREVRLFRVIIFVYLFVFALSLFGLFWEFMVPGLDRLLAASLETPWGIFTSLFMHADLLHLAANMSVLTLYLFYFVLTNFYNSRAEIRRRAILASLLVFVSAIFSNLLWIFVFPGEKAIGSSGLVYAFIGITFGFALCNILVIAVSGDSVVKDWMTVAGFLSQEQAGRVRI
ncbi:MAG: rhomboid family intramembrane serine protease [Candidatus Bathyarchaeia archaeon]|nr:rhomboid family intramembrane serine protease [Candidatus Bathyarchaeota archaeon]